LDLKIRRDKLIAVYNSKEQEDEARKQQERAKCAARKRDIGDALKVMRLCFTGEIK
jgi:hypothetical protein